MPKYDARCKLSNGNHGMTVNIAGVAADDENDARQKFINKIEKSHAQYISKGYKIIELKIKKR